MAKTTLPRTALVQGSFVTDMTGYIFKPTLRCFRGCDSESIPKQPLPVAIFNSRHSYSQCS